MIDELRSGLSGFVISKNRILEASNEELQNFASVIAHEVKSQVHSPLMALSLIKEGRHGDKIDRIVDLGIDSLTTLSNFTSEMLGFSQMQVNFGERSQVNLSKIARQAAEQAIEVLAADHIKVTIHDLPTCLVSQGQSHHLFLNLIRNAIIHGPEEDQRDFSIEIGTESTDEGLSIFVKDNGRGIPDSEHERIFEYFYRGQKSIDRKGSGIGLGFIRRLLEREGGRIWVKSKTGEGATFCFTLSGRGSE